MLYIYEEGTKYKSVVIVTIHICKYIYYLQNIYQDIKKFISKIFQIYIYILNMDNI